MDNNYVGAPDPLNPTTPVTQTPNTNNQTPNIGNVPMATPDPMSRPMEQAPATKPKSKKGKIGAIFGIILAGLVVIGGGVAAVLLAMNMQQKDPVATAMAKIMRGEAPSNVIIDGDINIAIEDDLSPLTNINISLNSDLVAGSLVNNSAATVTVSMENIGDFAVEFDEIYAGDGNLYFKMDGLSDALEESGILSLLNYANEIPEVIDCGADDYCSIEEIQESTCTDEGCIVDGLDEIDFMLGEGGQSMLDTDVLAYFGAITKDIDIIDGTWLKISLEDLNDYYINSQAESNISCITTLVDDINLSSDSAAELYSKNPFLVSTNGDKTIASKKYTVYQVNIDNENFANFVNSIQNPTMATDLYSCLGWDNNIKITESDVASVTNVFPDIFAEIDENDNFSRLYLKSELTSTDGCNCPEGDICSSCLYAPSAIVTIDLNFSYPANINISEPDEYVDYAGTIKEIMSAMFDLKY